MLPFHERLARLGLEATAEFGFVLAGGYAISANGMGDRPSQDVDLFTNVPDPRQFATAVGRLRSAFGEAGFVIQDLRIRPTFVDLRLTDPATGESSDLQMGLDYRQYPPAHLTIGPVLDVRDAVAGKMSALWSRGEARDYIDIDTVLESGRFTPAAMLLIADEIEATPLDRTMLATRFREAERHDEAVFASYGVDLKRRQRIIERFAAWADDIDPEQTTD